MKRLGIGVIGLGVGEQLARTFKSDSRCNLLHVFDIDFVKSKKIASDLGTHSAENINEILDDPSVDILVVATYDDSHIDQVVPGIQKKKHIFCEKPLCVNYGQLNKISKTWKSNDNKVKFFSNLVLRGAPVYSWLRKQIMSGEFGEIYSIDGDYLYGRLNKITKGWRGKREYSPILGGGIHMIDLICWLTNKRAIKVNAYGNNISTKSSNLAFNDYVEASIIFEDNMVARISCNLSCVHRHQHVLRIFGTKKTFILDDQGPRIHETRNPDVGSKNIERETLPNTKGILISSFVDAIIDDKDTVSVTQEVFDIMSIGLAIDESLKSGKEIKINYV